ncbi:MULTISPECIES: hypothetical protein [Pseudofrankia]|uniref:hypothetical protein n=1 Tax=Pseudofrankia TaxID=2994363 RepID=UPI000234C43B|nr:MULTISPECIES: hypothetical protein [Pseudofrankia]OHV40820.1 hypothetical protein BCD49_39385 [Pseudofrankia sp. EUN1h]
MSGDRVSSMTRLSADLTVGGGAVIDLHTYPHRSPILSLHMGAVSVTIAFPTGDLGEAPMRFVREFADAAARFTEDCERFATTKRNTPGGSAPGPVSAEIPPASRAV